MIDKFDVIRELEDGEFISMYLGKLWDDQLVAVKKIPWQQQFWDSSSRVNSAKKALDLQNK